jgi:hypothetical protein
VAGASSGALGWKKDFVMWSMRNDSLVTTHADAVFAGYGIVAPEFGWNDYAGLDAKGKIVIVLVNDPGLQDSTIFRGKILTYYGRWTYKIEEAQRQGAAGILMIHTTESASYPWTTVLSGWVGPQVPRAGAGIVAGDRLAAAGNRRSPFHPRPRPAALTAAAARKGFQAVPLVAARRLFEAPSVAPKRKTYSPVAGHGPSATSGPDRRHYDHFGIGPVNGDSIQPEDNASGRLASGGGRGLRRAGHASRSVVFIGFAAENRSPRLAGPGHEPPFPLRDIAAILNLTC